MLNAAVQRCFRVKFGPHKFGPSNFVQFGPRLVGNQLHMEEPEMIPFSRYVINCFHGTPAKPKLPGQNTEHCEQTVDAWLGRVVQHSKTWPN